MANELMNKDGEIMSEQYDRGVWLENFLQNLGIDEYAIGTAIDDDNIDKSFQLIQDNPSITKDEFLQKMHIEEYKINTIPHKYRNYGNGEFNADKMFNDIQAHVKSGKNINEFFGEDSVLYTFLDHYYQLIIYNPINNDENFCDDGSDYSDELLLPLEKRSYDILTKIQWMIDNGADPNAGGDWLPLMPPVAFIDYAMTEFLLEHGANAHYSGEEDGEIPFGCGNYYIDDLDISALNYSFEPNAKRAIFDQILKIATLFARHGVTDVHAHCIDIDSKSHSVHITQARVKY